MSDEQQEQPQEAPNPWAPWQEVGFDPEQYDPEDVRNAYEGWNALADRDQRPYLVERMLQGNEIPEGMSLNEMMEAANLYWQAKNDPFGVEDEEPYYSEPDGSQYGPVDSPVEYGNPTLDPNYLRNVWQEDIQSIVDSRLQQMEQQYQERQQFEEFRSEMDRLRADHNLSDTDLQFLAPRAVEYVQPGRPIAEAISQAWSDFDEWRRNSLANYAQQQGRAPRTSPPGGLSASPEQPPRSLAEAQQMMENRYSNGF
jgi:hypothetical protein